MIAKKFANYSQYINCYKRYKSSKNRNKDCSYNFCPHIITFI